MPWDGSRHGGFTTGKPWLPLGPDHGTRNVAQMRADERSILNLYRRLIALRRSEPALAGGTHEPVAYRHGLLGYRRRAKGQDLSIVLNLGSAAGSAALPGSGRVLLTTHLDRNGELVSSTIDLRPAEGIIVDHN